MYVDLVGDEVWLGVGAVFEFEFELEVLNVNITRLTMREGMEGEMRLMNGRDKSKSKSSRFWPMTLCLRKRRRCM